MKKRMSTIAFCLVILSCSLLFGCGNNSDKPQDDNTPNVEEILPTSITLKLNQNSAWNVEHHITYNLEITPQNATNKTVKITSSNENVAWSNGHANRLFIGETGTTTFTATTANGLTSSVNFEVKSFISSFPEMPIIYSTGIAERYFRTYKLTSVSFDFYLSKDSYEFAEKIAFKFSGEKIYDARGENNPTSDSIEINLYDKDNYLIDTSSLLLVSVFLNDKVKDKEVIFRNVKTSGAPYTIKIVA